MAIILVNWNSHEFTSACVKSLGQVTYKHFEIILVDNGSDESSVRYLEEQFAQRPYLHWIKLKRNKGFTGGNNAGLRKAEDLNFDLAMLLNNDTVVSPDFLEPLVEHMKQSKVGAVQPKIYYEHDRKQIWNAGGIFRQTIAVAKTVGVGQMDLGQFEEVKKTDWITGCAFLIKLEAVKVVGLLDDSFFAYSEDVDWSLRLKAAGYQLLVVPSSHIYHAVTASSKSHEKTSEGFLSPKVHYLNVRNSIYLTRKHAAGNVLAFGYQLVKFVLYLIYFFVRWRPNKLLAAVRGFRDGWRLPVEGDQDASNSMKTN